MVCLALPADELVFVTPSDHRMNRLENYWKAVARAKVLAEEGYVVTFGIKAAYPETGFGYIEAEGEIVTGFREKPDATTAQAYIDSGRYWWNSGMLVFRADTILAEFERHSPEMLAACRKVKGTLPTLEQMQAIPSISIDFAVMEKSDKVRVVAVDPGWSDLGSFDALAEEVVPDANGNAVLGGSPPVFVSARNNLIVVTGRKVALIDVEGLMVIDTPDALLIVKRGSSQEVKDVVAQLKKSDPGLLE